MVRNMPLHLESVSRVFPCFVVICLKKQILSPESGHPEVLQIKSGLPRSESALETEPFAMVLSALARSFLQKNTLKAMSRFLLLNAFP